MDEWTTASRMARQTDKHDWWHRSMLVIWVKKFNFHSHAHKRVEYPISDPKSLTFSLTYGKSNPTFYVHISHTYKNTNPHMCIHMHKCIFKSKLKAVSLDKNKNVKITTYHLPSAVCVHNANVKQTTKKCLPSHVSTHCHTQNELSFLKIILK